MGGRYRIYVLGGGMLGFRSRGPNQTGCLALEGVLDQEGTEDHGDWRFSVRFAFVRWKRGRGGEKKRAVV